ncbi:MAG TPA: DUF4349 domain-containing protein [Candidatus Limnocylindrales bacterium]|nr:DUF4349 domain-containing protein [Candidatus Limnocylindrales bacterium]
MLSTAHPTFRRALVVVLTLVAAAMVAACGGSAAASPGGDTEGGRVGAPAATMAPAAPLPGSDGEEQPGSQAGNPRPAPANLLIIKTGTMTLQVAGIDAAITAATQQIDALGGYSSASQRSGDGDDAYASITFRIPVARWEEALTGLHGLAEKVLDEQTGTQDVTDQVVDLAARIRNLQATEAALQAIMAQAKEIKDVLAVQAQLTETRGEIERLTAEKGNFEAQAAFSTLTVAFSLKPNPVLAETKGFDPATEVDQASASLVGVVQALATAGIWFAIVWVPILLALAIVLVVGLAVARRVRRRLDADVASPAPTAGSGA